MKNIRIQLFQKFIGIYNKSNMTTCHKICYVKYVKHATLWFYSSRFRQVI